MSVWTKVTAVLKSEPEDWSVWAMVFEDNGLPGTVQTDEPPTMSAYLPPGSESGLAPLKNDLMARGAVRVETEGVPEEDWAESWKQFFKPRRIGGFVVKPTWESFDSEPGDTVIELDPGQAFGTGDHPTTRMCLELLERVGVNGKIVADIGCGSGILSIAAAMLGAAEVVSVDIDPLSVESTLENAARNGVAIQAVAGRGFDTLSPDRRFDIIVSNIISAALITLAPETSQRLRRGGTWIVSGIIAENWKDVQEAAERCGFSVTHELKEGEWVAAALYR